MKQSTFRDRLEQSLSAEGRLRSFNDVGGWFVQPLVPVVSASSVEQIAKEIYAQVGKFWDCGQSWPGSNGVAAARLLGRGYLPDLRNWALLERASA